MRTFYFSIGIIFLLALQLWFGYLHLKYPFLGIYVNQTESSQWVVRSLEDEVKGLDVRIGDIIDKVNGNHPDQHMTITKWRAVEQVDTLEVIRDGQSIQVGLKEVKNSLKRDVLPILAEIICFSVALLLYIKVRNSRSAKILSILFLNVGVTFMSLAASARGDGIAKLMLGIALPCIAIAFLHFLIAFFKEKCGLHLKFRMVYVLYVLVAYQVIVWFSWIGQQNVNNKLYLVLSQL
ncbi:hypothetical protein [Paenibacillus sp. GYB003]|uniref:hypothetical protein n=1 Tax=Paenibacillus sp. GYB003 TaxID=2994392 RepID=UPI002F962B6A